MLKYQYYEGTHVHLLTVLCINYEYLRITIEEYLFKLDRFLNSQVALQLLFYQQKPQSFSTIHYNLSSSAQKVK